MLFTSSYYSRSFGHQRFLARLATGLASFAFIYMVAGLLFSTHEGTYRRRRWLAEAISGWGRMEWTDHLLSSAFGIALAWAVVSVINSWYHDVKIVVGMRFLEEKQQLMLRIRSLNEDHYIDLQFSYKEVEVRQEKVASGLNEPQQEAITFLHYGEVIGHYFKKHGMWFPADATTIEQRL